MKKRLLIVISLLLILSLTLSGCGANTAATATGVMPSQSSEVINVSPSGEITVTPSVTPIVSQEVSPSPSATVDKEADAIVNQQIQNFLNYRGNYTEEKIQEKIVLTRNPELDDSTKLGLLEVTDQNVMVSGELLGYTEDRDGNIILIAGFDGKDNKRLVRYVEIVNVFDDGGFFNIEEMDISKRRLSGGQIIQVSDKEEVLTYLERMVDNPVVFSFLLVNGVSEEIMDQVSLGWGRNLFELNNQRAVLARKLISEVASNGISVGLDPIPGGTKLAEVTSWVDTSEIDINSVAIIFLLSYPFRNGE